MFIRLLLLITVFSVGTSSAVAHEPVAENDCQTLENVNQAALYVANDEHDSDDNACLTTSPATSQPAVAVFHWLVLPAPRASLIRTADARAPPSLT